MRPDHRHKHRSPCVAEPRPTGRHEQTAHHHNHAEFSASERSARHPTAVPCTWHCRKAPARLSRTCIRSCSRQTVGYSSSTESALEGQGGRGANAHTLRGLPAIQPGAGLGELLLGDQLCHHQLASEGGQELFRGSRCGGKSIWKINLENQSGKSIWKINLENRGRRSIT